MKTEQYQITPHKTSTEKVNNPDWALLPFVKADKFNPILKPFTDIFTDPIRNQSVSWDDQDILNPAAVVRHGKVYLLYRAREKQGYPIKTSRIGLAESGDGVNFTHKPLPVLYPDNDEFKEFEWQSGCEDPRIVEDGQGKYYMMYTAVQGYEAKLFVATSDDLLIWKKHGSAFKNAYDGKYSRIWTKSGSIISRYENEKIIATKINGKYWMYFGDSQIWIASSDDLINWTPLEMSIG